MTKQSDEVISGKKFHLTFKQLINVEPAKVDSSHVKINK